jgi:hypothetical protein
MARAEQMVDGLRSRFICWGWQMGECEARDFLRDFRMSLGKSPHWEKYQEAAHKWIDRHGQSLGWLLTGDPTSLIVSAALNSEAVKRSQEFTAGMMKDAGFKIIEPPKQKEAA